MDEVVKVVLPQITQDILREQKNKTSFNSVFDSERDLLSIEFLDDGTSSLNYLAKMGIVDRNSTLYRKKCANASFFPFSVVTVDQRIELIATNVHSL